MSSFRQICLAPRREKDRERKSHKKLIKQLTHFCLSFIIVHYLCSFQQMLFELFPRLIIIIITTAAAARSGIGGGGCKE